MTPDSQTENVVLEFNAEGAAAPESGDYREMDWQGLGEGADLIDCRKVSSPDEGLDMTPMVDVTFLLLIFFMVTASFVVQKSIAQPPFQDGGPSPAPVQDFVTVTIDSNNTFYVASRDEDEVECPSEREMWTRVKAVQENTDVDRMTILAHVDSMHKKVISAWDAGVVAGIAKISIETTEEEL